MVSDTETGMTQQRASQLRTLPACGAAPGAGESAAGAGGRPRHCGDHDADAIVAGLYRERPAAAHARAVGRLSPAHRAVIVEIYLNGCTAREAAVRLGIPEGTVFSRSYYALRVLRRELGVPVPGAWRAA